MSCRESIAKLRGLPLRIKRRVRRVSRYFVAAFTNKALIKYAAVGQCIYCGASGSSVELRREHILAYSLGGDAILPAASCPTCADITSEFEKYCADHIFLSVRVQHNIHSRRPEPTHLPILETFAPEPHLAPKVLVPVDDHPGVLILPSFDPPGMVSGRAPTVGSGLVMHFWRITNDYDQRIQRLHDAGIKGVKIHEQIALKPFLRMLAKIAHGMAVADYGIDGFRPLLIDVILKGDPSAPYFVGSATDRTPPSEPMKTWARTEVRSIGNKKYVVAFFRLFAYLGTPVYSVVVGERMDSLTRLKRAVKRSLVALGKVIRPLRVVSGHRPAVSPPSHRRPSRSCAISALRS